jgi:hypothetical protein
MEPERARTKSSKSTGPYDPAFQQHLIDHRIYPAFHELEDGSELPPPDNLNEILQILSEPRPSVSISDDTFRKFKRSNARLSNEEQVTAWLIPFIEGDSDNNKHPDGPTLFNNLSPLTDGSLTSGKPDRYHGAHPNQLEKQIRDELNHLIIPSTQGHLPIIPNFFLEVKQRHGSVAVAERQACYHGALGARGMQSIQSYKSARPIYDNRAYTITGTYHDGTLKLYTSHVVRPEDPQLPPAYVMTQLNSWSLTGELSGFCAGVAAYRNARDWAKSQRDEAIRKANDRLL